MKCAYWVAVAAAICAAATACGSSSSGGTQGGSGVSPGPTGSSSADPLHPLVPRPRTSPIALATTSATPEGRDERLVSLPWRYVGQLDGGRQVELEAEVGGCLQLDGVQVTETSVSVAVAVHGLIPTAQRVCPDLARIVTGTVTLRAPLGRRSLLHPVTATSRLLQPRQSEAPGGGTLVPGG